MVTDDINTTRVIKLVDSEHKSISDNQKYDQQCDIETITNY